MPDTRQATKAELDSELATWCQGHALDCSPLGRLCPLFSHPNNKDHRFFPSFKNLFRDQGGGVGRGRGPLQTLSLASILHIATNMPFCPFLPGPNYSPNISGPLHVLFQHLGCPFLLALPGKSAGFSFKGAAQVWSSRRCSLTPRQDSCGASTYSPNTPPGWKALGRHSPHTQILH